MLLSGGQYAPGIRPSAPKAIRGAKHSPLMKIFGWPKAEFHVVAPNSGKSALNREYGLSNDNFKSWGKHASAEIFMVKFGQANF